MGDVHDIMGLPRGGLQHPTSETPKPQKQPKAERPKGMSREAYALLDGSNPIVPSRLVDDLKRSKDKKQKPKPSIKGKVTYQWRHFDNPGRQDDLKLFHWVKCYKDANNRIREAEEGEYPFAKYNKKVHMLRYDDEEWQNVINPNDDSGWSREETDYLLDLCQQLELRFFVVADRYNFKGIQRTIEQIKERYYSVARRLLIAREGGVESVASNVMVKHPFNAAAEEARKRALEELLTRTASQTAAENEILEQASRILEERHKDRSARALQTGLATLIYPQDFDNTTAEPPFFDCKVQPHTPPLPGVYRRSTLLTEAKEAQLASAPMSLRSGKAVEALLAEVGIQPDLPRVYTRRSMGLLLALRGEVLNLLEMRKRSQSLAGPAGGAAAAGAAGGAAGAAGDMGRGPGKRKGMAGVRVEDAPGSAPPRLEKRQRLLKKPGD